MIDTPAPLPMGDTKVELPKNVKAWVEALRFGDYKQTRFRLRGQQGYCCLGVACQISGLGYWSDYDYVTDKGSSCQNLPEPVMKWLGIRHRSGRFPGTFVIEDRVVISLADLNDETSLGFKGIADFIERNWRLLRDD